MQSNDRGGSGCARLGKNDLTYLAIRVTIQTLPRDGDFAGPAGACCYDHISDHNARRRTWRHCEGQRRRPALPGQTPANGRPTKADDSSVRWFQSFPSVYGKGCFIKSPRINAHPKTHGKETVQPPKRGCTIPARKYFLMRLWHLADLCLIGAAFNRGSAWGPCVLVNTLPRRIRQALRSQGAVH